MAQIGTLTRTKDGSYTGTIKMLSLNIKAGDPRDKFDCITYVAKLEGDKDLLGAPYKI